MWVAIKELERAHKQHKEVYEALKEFVTSNRALALTSPNKLTRDVAMQIISGQLASPEPTEQTLSSETVVDPGEALKAMNAVGTLLEFFANANLSPSSANFMKGLLHSVHHYVYEVLPKEDKRKEKVEVDDIPF